MERPSKKSIDAFRRAIAAINAAEEAIVDVWEEFDTEGFEHPSHVVALHVAMRFFNEMESTRHIATHSGSDAFRRDSSVAFLDLAYERFFDLAHERRVTPDLSMITPYGDVHGLAALFFLVSGQLLGLPVDTMIHSHEPPKDEVESGSIH